MSGSDDLQQVRQACRDFPARFQSLQLATVSADGQPEASYAPFVADHGCYYVYLSDLARHGANLREKGRASVLFIEGEERAKHPFARERLTLRCEATECPRGSERFEAVLDLFEHRFGKFVQMVRPLGDFRLFELRPEAGSYVAGFAKAYVLDGDDLANIRRRGPDNLGG